MSKVVLAGHIIVPDADLSSVQSQLDTHIELTRREIGCLVFKITQDAKNRNRFNVYEEFKDKTSFDTHQVRAGKSKWAEVTKNAERHYEVTGTD